VIEASEAAVSWREREHDDLVLAVALAAWQGERTPASLGQPLVLGQRWFFDKSIKKGTAG
jgi:hypothetical protein